MQPQVMAPLDRTQSTFGRRVIASAPPPPAAAPAAVGAPASPTAALRLALGTAAVVLFVLAGLATAFWTLPGLKAVDAASAGAVQAVIAIVDKPVDHLPRTLAAGEFSPGWFHPGAITPDFANVDVRATQEFPYAGYTYVASDVTPNEMFIAKDLEFNAMTKIFYIDRNLPKARLSEAEMLEINRLYRIIGHADAAKAQQWTTPAGLAGLGLLLAVGLFFVQPSAQPRAD